MPTCVVVLGLVVVVVSVIVGLLLFFSLDVAGETGVIRLPPPVVGLREVVVVVVGVVDIIGVPLLVDMLIDVDIVGDEEVLSDVLFRVVLFVERMLSLIVVSRFVDVVLYNGEDDWMNMMVIVMMMIVWW